MAARLAPGNVKQKHQSLCHLVADASWDGVALPARAQLHSAGADAWSDTVMDC
jgi:hypothetical protein